MTDLHIPNEAYDAADRFFAAQTDEDDMLGAVDAAVPYIVAAFLRREADGVEGPLALARARVARATPGTTEDLEARLEVAVLAYHRDELLHLADELEAGVS